MIRSLGFVALAIGGLAIATAATHQAQAQSGVGQACGGPEGTNCSVGLFCEAPPGKCQEDNPEGVCVVRTEACTKIYQPVCGCDGKTYGNDCERIAAAASKARDGQCEQQQSDPKQSEPK